MTSSEAMAARALGMSVVPAHQKDALTIVEGMVIDNRNQFVYFAGSSEGMGSTFGPLATVHEQTAIQESRLEALKSFGDILLKEGHLWGRKEVAIPVSAVASLDAGIRLNITRKQVEDLPPLGQSHP